ncbi:PstS family phosphate ABC transporter substrate-binding protein [Pontibacter arcticus]|uniref:Phosphate ABC transporter substrate-binding protein, PhoT family n=1 Tax=Pontibacter arcticus TaxID=2080288 RepID=A0A364RAZ0_9BACT|nr:substrate-binding domain-containing protein [Pontibacter arcticus]RAU81520.1 phosphate ABC transporter substrate-binding protein, PhoT family [Pontibacter arcticus]
MKNNLFHKLLLLAFAGSVFTACNQSGGQEVSTPTAGNVVVTADESFQPIIESQISTFEGIYKRADVEGKYKPEGEAMNDLLNDSTKIVILSRELTETEKAAFEKKKRFPKVTKLAVDAVALVVNKSNPDSLLTMDQVKQIFSGTTTTWKALNSKSTLENITIVFDNNNSSTARYVRDSLTVSKKLPGNTFASNSHKALIDYVAQNKNAIGVIGVNWISDSDDTTAVNFTKQVKVIGISTDPNPATTESYYQPYQAYIAQGTYPLRRNLYVINVEGRAGLGTGFVSFIAGDKGQRIILKSGLVPATMPVRVIGVK